MFDPECYRQTSLETEPGKLSCYTNVLRTGRPAFDSRQGQEIFLCFNSIQTGSGAHPASTPVGTEANFSGGKAAGMWSADNSRFF
jgi:hypothetical protein